LGEIKLKSASGNERFSFFISSLLFNDNSKLNLDQSDIIVFVGSNNVGKTVTLGEIEGLLEDSFAPVLLKKITTSKTGSNKKLRSWLNNHYKTKPGRDSLVSWDNAECGNWKIDDLWNKKNQLGDLTPFLTRFVCTEKRLQALNPVESLDILREPCEKSLQVLAGNRDIENKLSDSCFKAFGIRLFLDRWSGKQIRIRCGSIPNDEQWSLPFLNKVKENPPLDNQGDGIQSFVGCFLEGILSPHPVVFIDEPEAFLHPHHARILGQMLSESRGSNRQMFIATHSLNIILGLLDTTKSNIRIVRITRAGDLNPISELNEEHIKNVWKDPMLRSSNVLEGIFHEQVVLCEGDADCRFYSCVLDALINSNVPAKRPDVMFTSCGGKQKMPTVIRALRALNVPIRTIVDFDVLQNGQELMKIIEAYDLNWEIFKPLWNNIYNGLLSKAPSLSLSEVKTSINDILLKAKGAYLDENTRNQLFDCLRESSPWKSAKLAGKNSLPQGNPANAFMELTRQLSQVGIFIVPCGELERFVQSAPGHGPKWVTEVLSHRDLGSDPELKDARGFVSNVVGMAHKENL